MESPYKTSEEGLNNIRYNLLRNLPIQELENLAIRNPKDILVFHVLTESFEKVKQVRESYAILNAKRPFEGC